MPARALRPCSQPGCAALTASRYCANHQRDNVTRQSRRQFDRNRADDPYRRLYGTAAWRRTRAAILARDPLCKIARKCVERFGTPVASTEVDHIQPTRSGGDLFDAANLQGVCRMCHSWKTALEDSAFTGNHKSQEVTK